MVKRIRNNQDIEFLVDLWALNGTPFNLDRVQSWGVNLKGTAKAVSLKYEDGTVTSDGDISANANFEGNRLHIYAKSSETAFGEGNISIEMELTLANENFEDEAQVIRTYKNSTGIYII